MMKTKLARTAVKLAIASTTAQSNATSLPISFVVSVATLVTWPEIVQIDYVEQTGATTYLAPMAQQPVVLVLEMLSTENMK